MNHDELQSLLGAYAVDAVDPDEAAAIDAHLVDCPRCRAEVAELREVAAMLTYSGADAPDGVWDSIAGALQGAPPPLRLEVQRERRDRWRVPRNIAIGVAAASVAVLGIGIIRLRGEVDDLRNNQTTDQAAVAIAAERAIGAPDARIARLTGSSGDGAVAVVQPNGQGYLVGTSLPDVGPSIYQLWGMTSSGTITSLGTIPGPGVYGFSADPSIGTVMITVEDEPVAQPTSDPVVRGDLA
jgi:anti-sigma factor RsiW